MGYLDPSLDFRFLEEAEPREFRFFRDVEARALIEKGLELVKMMDPGKDAEIETALLCDAEEFLLCERREAIEEPIHRFVEEGQVIHVPDGVRKVTDATTLPLLVRFEDRSLRDVDAKDGGSGKRRGDPFRVIAFPAGDVGKANEGDR